MNIAQIEENVINVTKSISTESFIYDLLSAYGYPKASVARLQNGSSNLSKNAGEIVLKKKLLFKSVSENDIYQAMSEAQANRACAKYNPRFIIVTNYETLMAVDTATNETIEIGIKDLGRHCDFFLPLAGYEKATYKDESPVDVRATECISKLVDDLRKTNEISTYEQQRNLNIFLTRLLFCFFAEDVGIFEKGLFINSLISHTQPDASDIGLYLEKLFNVLNMKDRKGLPEYLRKFAYVNGELFKKTNITPLLSRKARQLIIEIGQMNWACINPDIFGSMIQIAVSAKSRGYISMHYTNVKNIMKVIKPLFLDSLYDELRKSNQRQSHLIHLLDRISKIKIFDPVCGSGNFLIVAYKELRKYEVQVIRQLGRLNAFKKPRSSRIKLSQFYGIQQDALTYEMIMLSLWLAEYQMNIEYVKEFDGLVSNIPIRETATITSGNATRLDWNKICPKLQDDEVYVVGNPPYKGARKQSIEQKSDVAFVFNGYENTKNLDYAACWFYLGSLYIKSSASKFAFGSTNSICQGEQVGLLWPILLKQNVEISFAYTSFKWASNATGNTGVTVIIIGMQTNGSNSEKTLYIEGLAHQVNNISPYLTATNNIIVHKRSTPISNLPLMPKGNMPYDGGNLILNTDEKNNLLERYPSANKYIKRLMGSDEFINDIERWCLWVSDEQLRDALSISSIKERIDAVKQMRLSSTDSAAHDLAKRPHQFRETNVTKCQSLIIPSVSSERREYLPIGFVDSSTIITNLAFAIYEAETWLFGVIASKMHMAWIRAVCGSLETRLRYSSALGYNTFPMPNISAEKKDRIERLVIKIIEQRQLHSEKTMAQLYDPDKMPRGLLRSHCDLDEEIDSLYREKSFESNNDRLQHLFVLYDEMTNLKRSAKCRT